MATAAPTPELELLCDFVNSQDLEVGTDALSTPVELSGWFRDRGIEVGQAASADLALAHRFREALRRVLEFHNGHDLDPGALTDLNRAAEAARLRLVMGPDADPRLGPAVGGVAGAIGALCSAMLEAAQTGEWARLKACRDGSCRWAFYDASKNGSRTWCAMKVCGSRAKMRAYRARQRQEA